MYPTLLLQIGFLKKETLDIELTCMKHRLVLEDFDIFFSFLEVMFI